MQDRWICLDDPCAVFVSLGIYECSNCGKRVLAMGVDAAETKQASIVHYKFCPYCGKEKYIVR